MKFLALLLTILCSLQVSASDRVLISKSDRTLPIAQLLSKTGKFNTLIQLLTTTGLDRVVADAKKGVIAAPTDVAFAKLSAKQLAALANNPEDLKRVLLAHFGPEGQSSVGTFTSALGTEINISAQLPGDEQNRNIPGFVNRVKSPEIFDIEGFSTTYASNRISSVNGGVKRPDIIAIDEVLSVPAFQSYANFFSALKPEARKFNKLAELLAVAEIPVSALQGKTLLAPTNEAIHALGEETIQELLNNKPLLQRILLFHVVKKSGTVATLISLSNNINLPVGTAVNQGLNVVAKGQAKIIEADLFVGDAGYIQIIDKVLIP